MDKYNKIKLNYKRFGMSVSVNLSESDASAASNTSVLHMSVTVTTNGSSHNTSGNAYIKGSVSCNGNNWTINKSTYTIGYNATKTVYEWSETVTHNPDGSCGDASASIYVYLTSSTSGTYSGSCRMSTIELKPYFTSVSYGTSSEGVAYFSWDTNTEADAIQYTLNDGSNWNDGSYPTTYISTTPGDTINLKLRARSRASQLWSDTYDCGNITTYDYPHPTYARNFSIGDSCTIGVYNPLGRTYDLVLKQNGTQNVLGSYRGTIDGEVIGFNTENNQNTMYSTIPNSQSGNYIATITYGSSVRTSNVATYSVKPSVVQPNFSNFDVTDANSSVSQLTGSTEDNPIFIPGFSIPSVKIKVADKATANHYASTISKYELNINSVVISADYSETEDVTLLSTVPLDNNSINVNAIDSRGISKTVSKTVETLDYSIPNIKSMSVERDNNGIGTSAKIKANGTWWNDNFGAEDNAITSIKYYYQVVGSSDEYVEGSSTITATYSNNYFTISNASILGPGENGIWEADKSYKIKLVVSDKINGTDNYEFIMPSGSPAIAIYDNKVALGGKYDTSINAEVQIYGNAYTSGNSRVIGNTYTNGSASLSGHLYTPNVGSFVAACNTGGENGYFSGWYNGYFSSVTIYDSEYLQNIASGSGKYLKVKKKGLYKISWNVRWNDNTASNNNNVGVGISKNNVSSDDPDKFSWYPQIYRITANGTIYCGLNVGDTIRPLFYSDSSTYLKVGHWWIEYIDYQVR